MTWVVDTAIKDYYKFLQDNTVVLKNDQTGWVVISTPFIGLFNDTIDIYCKENNGIITLSDDGKISRDLDLCGTSLTRSARRKEIVEKILLNYGIKWDDGEFITYAKINDFPQKKHNLISAMLEISDLYVLSKQNIISVFKEDVASFLDEQDIIYTPQFISKGSTGLEFTFDFQVAGRKREIVINTFNTINMTNLSKFLFGWDDIKETRQQITQKEIISLAIINNDEKDIKREYLDALSVKGSDHILWTERHRKENLKKLIA